MGPAQAIWTCLRRSFQFKGRSSRPEFWWYAAFAGLGWFARRQFDEMRHPLQYHYDPALLPSAYGPPDTVALYAAAIATLPLVSALFRRLTDAGLSPFFAVLPAVNMAIFACGIWLMFGPVGYNRHRDPTAIQIVTYIASATSAFIAFLSSCVLLLALAAQSADQPNPIEAPK